MDIVITKLQGGLGNQMFQYALGRHLSLMIQAELKLDITSFKNDPQRDYALDCFNIQEAFATDEEIQRFKKYLFKKGRWWFWYNRTIADRSRYVWERQFNFEPWILTLKGPLYLDGYWNTEKYFKDIEEVIRKDFTLKNPLSDRTKVLKDEIMTSEAVSIHVRRGDYVIQKETNAWHGTCSIEYYDQAVQKIAEHTKDPYFFIFSDDPEWAKEHILPPFPSTYVSGNAKNPEEDLYLMSLCKHNIVANSSFSWWGAWLNANADKIVIAPKQWFTNDKMDTRDIVPDTWVKL